MTECHVDEPLTFTLQYVPMTNCLQGVYTRLCCNVCYGYEDFMLLFFTYAIQMSLTLAVCFAMTVFLLWSISDDDSCFLFHWFVGERLGPLTPTPTPMLFLQERIYDATAVHICLLEVSIMEKKTLCTLKLGIFDITYLTNSH